MEPENISQIVEVMRKIIEDRNLRDTLIKEGLIWVKKYSWQKMR